MFKFFGIPAILSILYSVSCQSYDYSTQNVWTGSCNDASVTLQSPISLIRSKSQCNQFINLESKFPGGSKTYNKVSNTYSQTIEIAGTESNNLYYTDIKRNFIKADLQRITFHTPSEHQIDGRSFDLELQIEYKTSTTDGIIYQKSTPLRSLAKVSIFFKSDVKSDSTIFAEYSKTGTTITIDLSTQLDSLINGKSFYLYQGTFTVDPCADTLNWIIVDGVYSVLNSDLLFFKNKWMGNAAFPTASTSDGNNRAIKPLNNRDLVYNTANCLTCGQGYTLYNSICYNCPISFCSQCQSDNVCSQCTSGYTLNGNQCYRCVINNCKTCNSVGTCVECEANFNLVNGNCIQCKIPFCNKCTASNECSECKTTFTLKSSTECICQIGFYPDFNSIACIGCADKYSNCNYCDSNKCTACKNGFYLTSSGTCQACSLPNCGVCTQSTCSICSNEYYLNGNSCSKCHSSCLTCSGPNNNQCTSCRNNFFLHSTGKCLLSCFSGSNSSFVNPDNCQYCESDIQLMNLKCSECKETYFYDANSNTCKSCDVSCRTCSGVLNTQCTACFQNMIYDQLANLCYFQCHPSCLKCNGFSSQSCTACDPSTILYTSECISTEQYNYKVGNLTFQDTTTLGAIAINSQNLNKVLTNNSNSIKMVYCHNITDCSNGGNCVNNLCQCKPEWIGVNCEISASYGNITLKKNKDLLNSLFSYNSKLTVNDIGNYLNSFSTLASNPIIWDSTSITNAKAGFDKLEALGLNNLNTTDQSNYLLSMGGLISAVNLATFYNDVQKKAIKEGLVYTFSKFMQNQVLNATAKTFPSTISVQSQALNTKISIVNISDSSNENFTIPGGVTVRMYDQSRRDIKSLNLNDEKITMQSNFWTFSNPFSESITHVQVSSIVQLSLYKSSGQKLVVSNLANNLEISIPLIRNINIYDKLKCAYLEETTSTWKSDGMRFQEIQNVTNSTQRIGKCLSEHLSNFVIIRETENPTNFEITTRTVIIENYGFWICIGDIVIMIACYIIISITKSDISAIPKSKSQKSSTRHLKELAIYIETIKTEEDRQLNSKNKEVSVAKEFENFKKTRTKGESFSDYDTLNPWMLFPFYSISKTPSASRSSQKLSLLNLNFLNYVFFISIIFSTVDADVYYNGGFILWGFISLICTWILNYVYGLIAVGSRFESNNEVRKSFWILYVLIWLAYILTICWTNVYINVFNSNVMLVTILCILIIDWGIFDILITLNGKRLANNNSYGFQRYSNYFKFRGYYE